MNPGKHRSDEPESPNGHGRHRPANTSGLMATALIERVARTGHAIRLAWQGTADHGLASADDDFPTAVLPVVRNEPPDTSTADEDTEPTMASREARQWLGSSEFSWWIRSLVQI